MDTALVADVVAEVMKRLNGRGGNVRAGETRAAEEPKRAEGYAHPHRISDPIGQYNVFTNVDDAVKAATASQIKLMKLSLEDRDGIVKLIKKTAKDNAAVWGKMKLDKTKI